MKMTSHPIPGRNTDPSPMTYEVSFFPSIAQTRARLAAEADAMNADELRAAATDALIDVQSAKTKKELVAAVREGARTVVPSDAIAPDTATSATASAPTAPKPEKG
jgi:hypothetical protein